MNVLNNSSDEVAECPLCMEPLEVDDLNFYPCTCGYQICRFCWHRIRTGENELCPACRKAYPENPADFTPLSQEQIAALKAEKRQRDQQRKQKITENRKHLANVRVVQKNLVFVVGLPPRLADADILKKHEYFGKYGKIHKVVINPSTAYAGLQGPSASAYVTYVHNNDALRAIQSVNNIIIDGRLIKTSLGTTKYCSHFMKNQQCPKADCMYLHELGDSEASFTKEEMHQGKHQEYEKRLHDALIASSNGSVTTNCKNGDTKLGNGTGPVQSKEAWPSLSVSPVNKEIVKTNGKGKDGKHERKHDKTKGDKKGQKNQKVQNNSSNHNNHNNNNNNNNKENNNVTTNGIGSNHLANLNGTKDTTTTNSDTSSTNDKQQKHQSNHISADDEINLIEDLDKDTSSEDNDGKNADTRSISSSSSNNGDSGSLSESTSGKSSPGSFPDHPLSTTHDNRQKSSDTHENHNLDNIITPTSTNSADFNGIINSSKSDSHTSTTAPTVNGVANLLDTSLCLTKLSLFDDSNSFFTSSSFEPLFKGKLLDNDTRTTMNNQLNSAITSHLPDLLNGTNTNHDTNKTIVDNKFNIFKGIDGYQNQNTTPSSTTITSSSSSSTAATTNGSGLGFIDNTDKYLLSLNTTEDWEAALNKYLMLRNNKQIDDQHDEYMRMHEMQKRNNLLHNISMGHMNDFPLNGTDVNRMTQPPMYQQQQQQQQQQRQQQQNNMQHHNDHMIGGNMFGTNMTKFFDFHKNQQQQQQHQQFMMNGHNTNGMVNDPRDHLSMATLLENNRINSQYLDHTNGLIGQQLQKQRLMNKFDQMGSHNHNMLMNNNNNSQQQQNRVHNQFNQNTTVEDDLGFDPFIETQKALAELMENEMVQQQAQNNHKHLLENCQRTRMPPPGFNHMNAFGFGVPRAQGSKILPFMNMGNNGTQQQQQQINQQQQQQQQQQNNWSHHMGFPQQPSQGNDQQVHMGQQNQNGSNQHSKTGYGNMSDWTAMDPAILSFRQFPSYSSHQHPQQHTTPDMFMQHLTQQNVQQSGQGFGHHGLNLQNNLLNQQQNSPAQVNYSHSNWFNTEQSMFMNSLANGYTSNYEKFSIPMPPGIHSNNINCISGNKQQKTECIN